MDRPRWWKFDSPGEYLFAQYNYIKEHKNIKVKDFIVLIGAKNRSSLYNIFRNTLRINPDKIELYRTVFRLSEEEGEYVILLTIRDSASCFYAKNVLSEEVKKFIKSRKPKNTYSRSYKSLESKWDEFNNSDSNSRKKKRVKVPLGTIAFNE